MGGVGAPPGGAGCSWGAEAAGASNGTGGADGAGGTAVPSFSVLTACLLDPRLLLSVALGRARARCSTVRRGAAVHVVCACLLYAVSFSHGTSEHHKRCLWVCGHSLYR